MKGAKYENPKHKEHREYEAAKDREYREIAGRQRAWANRIADDLIAGNVLSDHDKDFAARILRVWAHNLSDERKRPKGKPATFDHAALVWDYWKLRLHGGMKDAHAKAHLAEQYECSDEQVRKLIAAHGEDVRQFLAGGTVYWSDEPTK